MQPFAELAALVEGRWRGKNYDDNLLPGIAAAALREAELPARINPWDIIRWVHATADLPRQQDPHAKFGDPPITLFVGQRFHIDVYYWLDSTTAIHQHTFSGAFQVLLGGSVQSNYEFKGKREINSHLVVGDISLKDVSLLGKGDIQEIHSGPRFIHSLFHLERPSATIVIRSSFAAGKPVQFNYLKPHLAINPFFDEPWMARKVQTVSLLLSANHPEADQIIGDLLDAADFHTTFAVLDMAFRFLGRNELEALFKLSKSADRFRAMLDRARRRHGALADLLPDVFGEKLRQADIIKRRGMIDGINHRFFLALLLNVGERAKVLELVTQRFPDKDPVELVTGWVRELANIKVFGSPEPNVLGVAAVDNTYLEVLAGLFRGLPDKDIAIMASEKSAQVPVGELIKRVKTSPLFKSIFMQAAATPASSN